MNKFEVDDKVVYKSVIGTTVKLNITGVVEKIKNSYNDQDELNQLCFVRFGTNSVVIGTCWLSSEHLEKYDNSSE